MKILFICRSNVGRSQAAMEFYNAVHPNQARSAGTEVDVPGITVGERQNTVNIIQVMKEHGIDISGNIRIQLTEQMADNYDKLIVMSEPQVTPDWLTTHPKTVLWPILDTKGQNVEMTRKIVNEIEERVKNLG